MFKFLIIFYLSSLCQTTFAYPQFIGFGYNACLTCHYNPYGNGPLNDYGRGLSATTISDRILHNKGKSEEEIAKNSTFLYMESFHKSIKPSFDYRGLYLDRAVDKKDGESEYINMQADLNLVYLLQENTNFFVSISYGYAPKPKALQSEQIDTYRSREPYIGYRPNDSLGLYLGLMDKVYGIRIPDHIAFSRQTTGLAQNDQSHGLLLHYNNEKVEIGRHSFFGNLDQEEALRQKGASLKVESNLNKGFKPGISILKSRSSFIAQDLVSLHLKKAFTKGSSILLELGKQHNKNLSTHTTTKSTFLFMQNHIKLRRGTYFFVTSEYFKPSDNLENEIMRLGPGIQYFLHQGIELRADLYNTKSFNPAAATKDTYDFTAQVHLWF
jgi:hypothetical protein